MFIWKMAWRNIQRHKTKSLVVGVILFAGMLIMTLGNAVIEGARQGLLDNLINQFSSEIVVVSDQQTKNDIFMAPDPVRLIRNYLPVKAFIFFVPRRTWNEGRCYYSHQIKKEKYYENFTQRNLCCRILDVIQFDDHGGGNADGDGDYAENGGD